MALHWELDEDEEAPPLDRGELRRRILESRATLAQAIGIEGVEEEKASGEPKSRDAFVDQVERRYLAQWRRCSYTQYDEAPAFLHEQLQMTLQALLHKPQFDFADADRLRDKIQPRIGAALSTIFEGHGATEQPLVTVQSWFPKRALLVMGVVLAIALVLAKSVPAWLCVPFLLGFFLLLEALEVHTRVYKWVDPELTFGQFLAPVLAQRRTEYDALVQASG